MLRREDALLIVDVQRDFPPGGALAVPEGDAVVAPLSACARGFAARGLPVFASRDWHPADHCSFPENGGRRAPYSSRTSPWCRSSPRCPRRSWSSPD